MGTVGPVGTVDTVKTVGTVGPVALVLLILQFLLNTLLAVLVILAIQLFAIQQCSHLPRFVSSCVVWDCGIGLVIKTHSYPDFCNLAIGYKNHFQGFLFLFTLNKSNPI